MQSAHTPIVCFSHLAWDPGLFQRPQQIMSRLAARGHTVYYFACVGHNRHKSHPHAGPVKGTPGVHVYTIPYAPGVTKLAALRKWAAATKIARVLRTNKVRRPILWFYHPSLFSLGYSHDDSAIVYDVMDHFPSFEATVDDVYFEELMMLAEADVIFTGGHSLHGHIRQMIETLCAEGSSSETSGARGTIIIAAPHCYPSGIDIDHFAQAQRLLSEIGPYHSAPGPVFGYFGAIDERIDWDLIRHLANATPGQVVLAGPILREPPSDLPGNVQLPGSISYQELPQLLSTFDVALIPFRDSALVRYVSPTKTPEYLAGGKPVVSTPIPDVVSDYGDIVSIAGNPTDFTEACLRQAASPAPPEKLAEEVRRRARTWDTIAEEMDKVIIAAVSANRASEAG